MTLRLVAQGALSLEGDVNEYLTSWRLPGGDGDLVRSAQVIQAAAAGEAGALLPPPLALEMVTPQAGGWGLGLMLSGQGAHRCFGHGGGNYGCQCILIGAVSGRKAVAVMTSSDPSLPVIWSLLAAVRDATSWSDLPASGGEWR